MNNAAIEAVKQWRYSPLVLNGTLTPFAVRTEWRGRSSDTVRLRQLRALDP
jgi:hypothetical protein